MTKIETKELLPAEVAKKLAEQIAAHPNAKILVSSPNAGLGEWNYGFCHVCDVGYEPEIGFLTDDDLGWSETFFSKDEYFDEYSDDPRPEEVPEFNEYIVFWCE